MATIRYQKRCAYRLNPSCYVSDDDGTLPVMRFLASTPLYIFFSALLSGGLTVTLSLGFYHPALIGVWILSCFLLLHRWNFPALTLPDDRIVVRLGIIGLMALPCLVRIFSFSGPAFHGDTLIPASFSVLFDPYEHNFFGPYPDPPHWVARFSTMHFAIQKLFFWIVGFENLLVVRLSVIPYVLIATLALYLLTEALWGRTAGVIAVLLYAFFPPSLYIETEAFHFSSSTAALLVLLAILVRNFHNKDRSFLLSGGVACAVCYLMYYGSYPALGIVALFLLLRTVKRSIAEIPKEALLFSVSFVIAIAPFFYEAAANDWYFLSRISDINPIRAEEITKNGLIPALNAFWIRTWNCIQQIAFRPIEGNGGYNFGQSYFLSPLMAIFVFVGIGFCLRSTKLLFVSLCLVIGFISLVCLSSAPPAFHRSSPFFPLICAIASIPLERTWRFSSARLGKFTVTLVLISHAVMGVLQLDSMKAHEYANHWDLREDLLIIDYIRERFPNRPVYVAAHPLFHFLGAFHFFEPSRKGQTFYHNDAVRLLDPNEDYLYVIFNPNESYGKGSWISQFQAKDPEGIVIKNGWKKFWLFVKGPRSAAFSRDSAIPGRPQ